MPPVIALVTDFGLRDHYVGAMKGSILGLCPDAVLVDIAHELPAHDILAGGFALLASYPDFPAGTVFVAVVDPGVGSDRRGLALEAGGYRFVAPDNGLLGLVLAAEGAGRLHAIENRALFRPRVSATFHARDVFGPVAAHLARGGALAEVGQPVHDPVALPLPQVRQIAVQGWEASVIHVDRFGNLTTNLGEAALAEMTRQAADGEVVVEVEGAVLSLGHTYADVPPGQALALIGSSRLLEVAVNQGDASRLLGAGRGAPVRVRAAGAML
jgi:S-adenosyl-L-methionine hydrolase (adenosine-forming)